jgi:hypothetical protein
MAENIIYVIRQVNMAENIIYVIRHIYKENKYIIRGRTSKKDRQKKWEKPKQWFTKHYRENRRLNNINNPNWKGEGKEMSHDSVRMRRLPTI